MMGLTSLDERGRVVIPKEVRDRLGLKPNQRLLVEVKDGGIVLRPASNAKKSIAELRGCIKGSRIKPKELKEIWAYSMLIIDSNIWTYYFDRDTPEHRFVVDEVEKALTRSKVAINTIIMVEVAHFLIKNLGALTGMEKVNAFLSFPFTVVDLTHDLTLKAIEYLTRCSHLGIGGRDAAILATMETLGLNQIMSHDKAFKKGRLAKDGEPNS